MENLADSTPGSSFEGSYEAYQLAMAPKPPSSVWDMVRKPENLSLTSERMISSDLSNVGGCLWRATRAVGQASATLADIRYELQPSRAQSVGASSGMVTAVNNLQAACRETVSRLETGQTRIREKLRAVTAEPSFRAETPGDRAAVASEKLNFTMERTRAEVYLLSLPVGERLAAVIRRSEAGDFFPLWAARASYAELVQAEELDRIANDCGIRALPIDAGELAVIEDAHRLAVDVACQCWQAIRNAANGNAATLSLTPSTADVFVSRD